MYTQNTYQGLVFAEEGNLVYGNVAKLKGVCFPTLRLFLVIAETTYTNKGVVCTQQ